MNELDATTHQLATLLTETQSGVKWCVDFFFAVHVAEWKGQYDTSEGWLRDKFRELIIGSAPSRANPLSFDPEKVQWRELYDNCYENYRFPDQFKTRETERLAGLFTLTPVNRWVIDFIKVGINSQGPIFGANPADLLRFREGVVEIIDRSDVSNLDLNKVAWGELFEYCHKQLEWAIGVAEPK